MNRTSKFFLISFIVVLLFAGFSNSGFKPSGLLAVADSARLKKAMESFRLEPGLRIELIASEPLVIDPVAFAFDENKRMYVVEDRGYPDPPQGGTPTTLGRIALLEDKDGDGKYDHRSEFATGLTYPNGIQVWKGGVFVTCAPNVYYLKDTDGDGVADIKKIVLTGFSSTRTAQIRVSHPTLGHDGKIYLTSGLNSGEVTSPEYPNRSPVSFSASDSRFNPDSFEFETTGGRSQFGLTFDAFGRRFGCSNRLPVLQIVLEPWHLRRNPQLLFTETTEHVSKVEAEAIVFPISGAVTSADFIPKLMGLSHTGTFTSASGTMIFNGSGLTPAHKGNIFICESAQNLVQRQVLSPKGVSFKSELPYTGKEFLSSTDEWFRPVFLQHGPEGALYIADMHRKVIDHPSYVPEEARGSLDFESGKTDGRIYRIVSKDFKEKKASVSPFSGSTAQIAAMLQSPEEWERQTAHRLLLERNDKSVVQQIKKTAITSTLPESRVRGLWLLNSFRSLDESTLNSALQDKVGGVREQAVLLAESLLPDNPRLLAKVASIASDPAARVRFNTALVLGSFQGPQVVSALAKIAAKDGADRWVRAAVLSGISDRLPEFLTNFRSQAGANAEAVASVMLDLGQLFGNSATEAECRTLLKDMILSTSSDYEWRISTVRGLAEGFSRRQKIQADSKGILHQLLGDSPSTADKAGFERFIAKAITQANNPTIPARTRSTAAALLGYTWFERSGTELRGLMDARNPSEVQLEAIASLVRLGDIRSGTILTEKATWSNYTPRVKSAVIAALVSKPEFVNVLFAAIEERTVAAAEISSTDRQRLMKHSYIQISSKAGHLFRDLEGGGRMKVYQDYRAILSNIKDAKIGKAAFERSCSSCHTYDGVGGKVGPDLSGVRNQPADALLLHIIVPNYEVLPAYQAISVETGDGRTISGWLVSETENSLTLKTAFGTQESVLRKNIKLLSNSGLSLMPDGLEQTMTKDELSALVSYLKTGSEEAKR